MINKCFLSLNLRMVISLLFVSSGTLSVVTCSSSDIPTESSVVPSIVSGTVFESVVEYDAGENPLGITLGDLNGDNNKNDILVTSPRKQDGISTTADGSMTLFLNNSSSTR